jgi:hypothetical protein
MAQPLGCIYSNLQSHVFLDLEDQARVRQRDEILDWLSPSKFWQKQNDVFRQCQKGTGEWFLNHSDFNNFLNGKIETLWCPGDRMFFLN